MPQWMQDLTTGWPMIAANIGTFLVIVALIFGAIWRLMNWRYGGVIAGRDGIIANRDSEITLLKGQRDDYKDKLGGATPDQAKARIDALEARLATLEPRLTAVEPRRLTADQRAALIARLTPPDGETFSICITAEGSGDSSQYAVDLSQTFKSVGAWKIDEAMALGGPRTGSGIAIQMANPAQPSKAANILISAFHAANIKFDVLAMRIPGADVGDFNMH